MLIAQRQDSRSRSLNRPRIVFIASFDAAGAFDIVTHKKLMRASMDFDVGPGTRRVDHNFLRERPRQVKPGTHEGAH